MHALHRIVNENYTYYCKKNKKWRQMAEVVFFIRQLLGKKKHGGRKLVVVSLSNNKCI